MKAPCTVAYHLTFTDHPTELDMRGVNGVFIETCVFLGEIGTVSPPMEAQRYRVTADPKVNVRAGPGMQFADIGDLFLDEFVYIYEFVEGWGHLAEKPGWVSMQWVVKA